MWQSLRRFHDHLRRHPVDANTPYLAGGATLVLLTVLFMGLFSTSIIERVALGYTNFAAVISAVLVDLTNTDRVERGVRQLVVNDTLTRAAQAKADDMARRGYFAHFDAEGRAPWDWMRDAGYEYKFAGENLAIQFSDSADVVRAWLNSPTHRENLLDNRFTEVGIAVAQGLYEGKPTIFVVQMFGTPLYTFSESSAVADTADDDSTLSGVAESTPPREATTTSAVVAVLTEASAVQEEAGSARAPTAANDVPAVQGTQADDVSVLGTSEVFAEDARTYPPHAAASSSKVVSVEPTASVPTAAVAEEVAPAGALASWWMHVFASPWSSIRYGAATALALFLALTLYSIYCELLQAHLMHGVYAGSLYAAFVLVFFAADLVFFRAPDVPVGERVAFIERHESQLAFVRLPGARLDADMHTPVVQPHAEQMVATAAFADTPLIGVIARFLLDQKGWVFLVVLLLIGGSGMAWQKYQRGES